MGSPKLVCAACGEVEVGIYCPLCRDCLREAKRAEMDESRDAQFREEMRHDAFGEHND